MPKKPASPEKNPPVRKANGTHGFCTCSPYAMNENITASTTNTTPTTLYCCLRYAIAPRLTCRAISFILSVPSSSSIIWRKKNHAIPSATTDATGTSQNTLGMFILGFIGFNWLCYIYPDFIQNPPQRYGFCFISPNFYAWIFIANQNKAVKT